MTNGVSCIDKVLGIQSKHFSQISKEGFSDHCNSPECYLLISLGQLSPIFFSCWPFPTDGFVPRIFTPYSVSNASESLERWALPPTPAQACQLYRNPGQWGERHLPVGFLSLSSSALASPKLWQSLSKNDRVTLKQKYVLQQCDWNYPASLADNYLNKKFSLKT